MSLSHILSLNQLPRIRPIALKALPLRWRLPCSWLTAVKAGLGALAVLELAALLAVTVEPVTPEGLIAPASAISRPQPTQAPEIPSAASSPSVGENPSLLSALSRPLFQIDNRQNGTARTEFQAPATPLKTSATRLSLIGVVAGSHPQAVLEDVQTSKTYVVTQGQQLLGGILIEEVRDTSVVLNADGERIELFL